MSEDPLVAQAETTTKISSALTPALILAGTSVAGGLAGIRFGPEWLHEMFAWLIIGGPVVAALQIAFFTIFDRDRLHSEKHLERKLLIAKITPQIGDGNRVIEMEAKEAPTENPKALGSGDV